MSHPLSPVTHAARRRRRWHSDRLLRTPRIDESRQSVPAQGPLGASVRAAVGLRALPRRAGVPLGQIVFFRAAFAIMPVLLIDAWRRELADVVRTERPFGHFGRGTISMCGMFLNFAALARLPLVDATAISFAAPLITVALRRVVSRRARPHLSLVGGRGRLCRHHRDAVALPQLRAIRIRRLGDRRRHRRRGLRPARRLHQRRLGDPDPAAHRHRDHVLDRVLLLAVLRDRGPRHLAVRLDVAERHAACRAGRAPA